MENVKTKKNEWWKREREFSSKRLRRWHPVHISLLCLTVSKWSQSMSFKRGSRVKSAEISFIITSLPNHGGNTPPPSRLTSSAPQRNTIASRNGVGSKGKCFPRLQFANPGLRKPFQEQMKLKATRGRKWSQNQVLRFFLLIFSTCSQLCRVVN